MYRFYDTLAGYCTRISHSSDADMGAFAFNRQHTVTGKTIPGEDDRYEIKENVAEKISFHFNLAEKEVIDCEQ